MTHPFEPHLSMEYGLPNSWVAARRRLQLIGECLDGLTGRRLEALGITAGWRCLEVGGGDGSVAALMAQRVAPEGAVVATDIDTRFLDERKGEHLEVWQHDVTTDPLPGETFDLVHTRSVLMHLPERIQVVEKLIASLRPGGWLLLEESDFYPVDVTGPEPYRTAWRTVSDALARAGMVADWARQLPPLVQGLGLMDVQADAEVAIFPGGSPMAELMALSFLQARDAVPAAARRPIDAAVEVLQDQQCWFPGPAVIGVRARRLPGLRNP